MDDQFPTVLGFPKLIHFVWWQGESALPLEFRRIAEDWKEKNPEWNIYIWDRDMLFRLIERVWPDLVEPYEQLPLTDNPERFRFMRHIDMVRPLIAEALGGLVIDMDMHPVQPLNTFIQSRTQFFRKADKVNPAMLENELMFSEPLDLSSRKLVMFCDHKSPEGHRCVAPGVILAKPNNGICQWFVRWALSRGDMKRPVLDCFGPRAWKDFLHQVDISYLREMIVMSNYCIWWHEELIKWIGPVPEWALCYHKCSGSWCDPKLEHGWEAV